MQQIKFKGQVMQSVRTRFAPSPTGYLHIGGARTALYCWLFARKMNGQFILRIEDTDLERSTSESVQAILDGMEWLSLDYDEGPHYQSKRMDRYQAVIDQLLSEGKAYRCYCSKERLEKLRAAQMEQKQKPRYDGFCREREDGQGPFVVRFKNPIEGHVEFNDLIRGQLIFANNELDDLILARSDGSPTYNFTVVVDDWDMQITHVIRGDDHINNTPRQINILRSLGAHLPQYAHLPMILGNDGKRLSKRHGAMSVMQYRDEGYLPAALLNYLVRLGWSHGDQEIFSMDEMIRYFDIKDINRAAAALNLEKLLWLNQHYLKQGGPQVGSELAWHLDKLAINYQSGPSLQAVIEVQAERTKTLCEMAERSRFFYEDFILEDNLRQKISTEVKPSLQQFRDQLAQLDDWQPEKIHHLLQETAAQSGLKLGQLAQPVRIATTGGSISPPMDRTLYLVGKDRVLKRLDAALHV